MKKLRLTRLLAVILALIMVFLRNVGKRHHGCRYGCRQHDKHGQKR